MFIGAMIRAFHRSAHRPGAAHLARLSSRFHRSARRPGAAHLALPSLQAFDVGGVVAADLVDAVATEFLEERVGQDDRHHRLSLDAGRRHRSEVIVLDVGLVGLLRRVMYLFEWPAWL